MADWTELPNSSLESGAPIRAVDGVALRDNPIAIAGGATGAPKIANAAFTDGTIGAEKFQAGTTEKNWINARIAGTTALSIGSMTSAYYQSNPITSLARNATTSGSNLYAYDTNTSSYESIGLSGTWRAMGSAEHYGTSSNLQGAILWLRIA